MVLKVSVIVPTYQSGDGIDRVVASLDAQSLAPDEFEVIFVDDGSRDGTFRRLKSIANARSNVTAVQIENSGWPSRPRNIGIGMARGEYVFFMDHDDELYPAALERSYEFGKALGADVISPKESKTSDVGWSVGETRENVLNAVGGKGIASLLPMVPHKFYRRDFVLEHGIRFPEGRRMLWEDIYFNIDAYRHASVVSVLGDSPVYKWVHTGSNNSTSYGPSTEEFWDRLNDLFDFIDLALAGERFADDRQFMVTHQYRSRVLGRFPSVLRRNIPAELDMAVGRAQGILTDHVPERYDERLGKLYQARAFLLRGGRVELLSELDRQDLGLAGRSVLDEARWEGGKLHLTTTTSWSTKNGAPFGLRTDGMVIRRRLGPQLEEALPDDLLNVTEALREASSEFLIRSRDERVTWAVPTTCEVVLTYGPDGQADLSVKASATIDPAIAAFGRPLTGPLWDVYSTNRLLGVSNSSAVYTDLHRSTVAFVRGRSAILYRNRDGKVSLDLAQRVRCAVVDAIPRVEEATVHGGGLFRVAQFSLPLGGVDIVGDTSLSGRAGLHILRGIVARAVASERIRRIPKAGALVARFLALRNARLVADRNGARLEGTIWTIPGVYSLVCQFEGRTVMTPVRVRVSLRGRVGWSITGGGERTT